jgi:hypothetical protein
MLLLAWSSSPSMVGIYAWGALIYTFIVALSDSPMRHIALHAAGNSGGDNFIRQYQWATAVGGPVIFAGLVCLVAFTSPDTKANAYWNLAPLGLAIVFLALNIRNIGLLQANGKWRDLAQTQLGGAMGLLLIGLPITISYSTALGPAAGVAVAEFFVFLRCRNLTRARQVEPCHTNQNSQNASRSVSFGRDYKDMSVYTVLTWTQGQVDRILVGFIGGTTTLGLISFASAISRALGDAVAASNANVLRSELAHVPLGEAVKAAARPVLLRGLWLATFAAFLMAVPGKYMLELILAPEWSPTLEIIPILALTSIPSILSWSVPVLNVAASLGRRSFIGPIVAIFMGPAVAGLAVIDLRLFAAGVFLREFLMVLTNYTLMGRHAPWNMFWRATLHSLVLTSIFLLIYPDLLASI